MSFSHRTMLALTRAAFTRRPAPGKRCFRAAAIRVTASLTILLAFGARLSEGALIVTGVNLHTDSNANFSFRGTFYHDRMSFDDSVASSSRALAGTISTPEARTAARLSAGEIAVNARLDGKDFFDHTDIQENTSFAVYDATIFKASGSAEHIFLHFLLPRSYVETTTNDELLSASVNSAILASVETTFISAAGVQDPSVKQFDFVGSLDSTFKSFGVVDKATGQAGLDLSPLLNPTLTDHTVFDANLGLKLRTMHLEFAPFEGVLDLGMLSAGQSVKFKYSMDALDTGIAAATVGIASINDPFFFDSDPVSRGAPIVIEGAAVDGAVPEPSSLVLCALGGMALLGFRKRVPLR